MQKICKDNKLKVRDEEDLGFILWQLESFEEFYPVFRTMIKKKD